MELAASNFARRFIGVQGKESPILGNFARPEAQNRNRISRVARAMTAQSAYARWAVMARATRACARATRRVGMCGYTAVAEDVGLRTCIFSRFYYVK